MTEQKTILIADDDRDLLDALAKRCEQIGLNVVTADDAMTALSCVDFTQPDLVCLDVNMPAGNGLSVCEMMATDSRLCDIPVIIMTGRRDKATEQRCHQLAAHYVPKSTDTWERLKPLLIELLQISDSGRSVALAAESNALASLAAPVDGTGVNAEPAPEGNYVDAVFSVLGWEPKLFDPKQVSDSPVAAQPEIFSPWVLSIDDDSDFSFGLKMRFAEQGVELLRAFGGTEGYRYAFSSRPQAIILDYEMPDGNGEYVLRRLKEHSVTEDIPVIMLTGRQDNALKRRLLSAGANAFLNKPLRWEELWNELKSHVRLPEASAI